MQIWLVLPEGLVEGAQRPKGEMRMDWDGIIDEEDDVFDAAGGDEEEEGG